MSYRTIPVALLLGLAVAAAPSMAAAQGSGSAQNAPPAGQPQGGQTSTGQQPTTGQTGSANVTVTVSDGTLTGSTTFLLSVGSTGTPAVVAFRQLNSAVPQTPSSPGAIHEIVNAEPVRDTFMSRKAAGESAWKKRRFAPI